MEEKKDRKKIVLMGLDNGGKTSIMLNLKGVKNVGAYNRLIPTVGINIETIDAKALVDLGCTISDEKGFGLSRKRIVDELKEFALKLNNAFERISPESGRKPDRHVQLF